MPMPPFPPAPPTVRASAPVIAASARIGREADDEDLDRPMPVVHAIDIVPDRPRPFRLPVLADRGDVAGRLAALDAMDAETDEDADDSIESPSAEPPPARPDRLARHRRPDTGEFMPAGGPVATTSPAASPPSEPIEPVSPVESVDVASVEADIAPTPGRVRAAAAVPPGVRLGARGVAPSPGAVGYSTADWRGRIKGAPPRAAAHMYGAPPVTVPPPLDVQPEAAAAAEPPSATALPTTPAGPVLDGTASTTVDNGDADRKLSPLDLAARIAFITALVVIFVLLFVFGPKISSWWSSF
jgi:hypothetical protein